MRKDVTRAVDVWYWHPAHWTTGYIPEGSLQLRELWLTTRHSAHISTRTRTSVHAYGINYIQSPESKTHSNLDIHVHVQYMYVILNM